MREIAAIVAMDESRLIGAQGALPWHLPADLKRFSALTTGHTVLMGSNTWRSLPAKFRPLPRRKNVVVSRNPHFRTEGQVPPEVEIVSDPEQFATEWLKNAGNTQNAHETLWVIGGAQLYSVMMRHCSRVELTIVSGNHAGDTYLEKFEEQFSVVSEEQGDNCRFLSLSRQS